MSTHQEWEKFFKDRKTVDNYKAGEKVTGQFAQALISQSGITTHATNPDKPLIVFDNACGTGVVSSLLHQLLDKKSKGSWSLTCGDISENMLEYARQRMVGENWTNTTMKIVDAQDVRLPSAHYTHVFTAFGQSSNRGDM